MNRPRLAQSEQFVDQGILQNVNGEKFKLVELRSTSGSTKKKSAGDKMIGSVIEFVIGLILIPFSIGLLWLNEGKMVHMSKLITGGKKACREADANEPISDNNF